MTNQVAADLRAAADVLERDGWAQGSMTDAHGCHCVLGAFTAALEISDENCDEELFQREFAAMRALKEVVMEDYGVRWLVPWNDAPTRSADEVIAALRAAADRAEESQ